MTDKLCLNTANGINCQKKCGHSHPIFTDSVTAIEEFKAKKTQIICHYYSSRKCKYGQSCQFLHIRTEEEMQSKRKKTPSPTRHMEESKETILQLISKIRGKVTHADKIGNSYKELSVTAGGIYIKRNESHSAFMAKILSDMGEIAARLDTYIASAGENDAFETSDIVSVESDE